MNNEINILDNAHLTAGQMMDVLRGMGFTDVERIPMDLGLHDPTFTYLIRAVKSA
jgi:hypothetical protein